MAYLSGKEFKEPLRQCPYNRAHQINARRFQQHLVKCRKDHPGTDLQICVFNATHHISPDEYQFHVQYTCEDRVKVEKMKYQFIEPAETADDFRKYVPPPDVIPDSVDQSENWETEATIVSSYDPQKKLQNMNGPVFSFPQGKNKSERKAYRNDMKERFSNHEEEKHLSSEQELNCESKTQKNKYRKPCTIRNKEETENNPETRNTLHENEDSMPLRRPKAPSQALNPSMGMGRGRGRIAADIFGQSFPHEENKKDEELISSLAPPPGFENLAPGHKSPSSRGHSFAETQSLINIVRGRGMMKQFSLTNQDAKPGGLTNSTIYGQGLSNRNIKSAEPNTGDLNLQFWNIKLSETSRDDFTD